VMMTAVSFIIGVLALFVAPRAGGPSPPHKGTNVFSRNLVRTQVGICLLKKNNTPPQQYLHICLPQIL
ncbi:hypothetical protein, partial [Enterobacter hormaechei]